jgi:hypothetical protein
MNLTKRQVQNLFRKLKGYRLIKRIEHPGRTNKIRIDWEGAKLPSPKHKRNTKLNRADFNDGNLKKWKLNIVSHEFDTLHPSYSRFGEAVKAGVVSEERKVRFLILWIHVRNRFRKEN